MQQPGGLTTGKILAAALGSLMIVVLLVAAASFLIIPDIQASERASAWVWFALMWIIVGAAATSYQLVQWRRGALALDTPDKRAKYAAQMRSIRSMALPIAAVSVLIGALASPSFDMAVGGAAAGFMTSFGVLGAARLATGQGRPASPE